MDLTEPSFAWRYMLCRRADADDTEVVIHQHATQHRGGDNQAPPDHVPIAFIIEHGGKKEAVSVVSLGEHSLVIEHDTGVFVAHVLGDNKVQVGEQVACAALRPLDDDAPTGSQKDKSTNAKNGEVVSPMPGRIVAVLVKDGQKVTQGQPLLVIEAMKMENELLAPIAGSVANLHANVGQAIDAGALVCTLV